MQFTDEGGLARLSWYANIYFNDAFSFYSTGIYQGTKKEQLGAFNRQLEYYSGRKREVAKDWFEAFAQLREYLESIDGTKPIVVFLDELTWMDTQKSRFVKAFEYFWNSWGAMNSRLKLIVCGSATTWMRENVLSDAECYMILGGTPLYLQMLERNLSLTQNVDNLFFIQNAPLAREYDFLFRSLFNEATLPRLIIETLAEHDRLTLTQSLERLFFRAAVPAPYPSDQA